MRYKVRSAFVVLVALFVGAVLLSCGSSDKPNGVPTETPVVDRVQEFSDILQEAFGDEVLFDNILATAEFEQLITELGLYDPRTQKDVYEYTRRVLIWLFLSDLTEEEAREFYGDEVYDIIKAELSSEGTVPEAGISPGINKPATLIGDFVMLSTQLFEDINSNPRVSGLSAGLLDKLWIKSFLYASKQLGDSGNEQLYTGSPYASGEFVIDEVYNLVFFKRSDQGFIVQAPEYVRNSGSFPSVGEPVLHLRYTNDLLYSLFLVPAEVVSISSEGTFVVEGSFSEADLGTSVFTVRNTRPVLAGVIIELNPDGSARVLGLDALLDRFEYLTSLLPEEGE